LQISRLLAVTALWVRIQTCFKNTKWAAEAKVLATHSSHHKKQYKKFSDVPVHKSQIRKFVMINPQIENPHFPWSPSPQLRKFGKSSVSDPEPH
jgi:hypothetical protein